MSSHEYFLELTGVYALDAVDDDEREQMEAHLAECGICRREVSEFRETAGLLAHATVDSPPGIWNSISKEINTSVKPTPISSARKSRQRVWLSVASAAAVMLFVVGATAAVRQSSRIDKLETQLAQTSTEQRALAAASMPGSKTFNLVSADKKQKATVVVTNDDRAFIVNRNLNQLDSEHAYQAWAVVGQEKISVGLLGSNPSAVEIRLPSNTAAIALTEEKSSGVVTSTQQPTVSGLVPAKTADRI